MDQTDQSVLGRMRFNLPVTCWLQIMPVKGSLAPQAFEFRSADRKRFVPALRNHICPRRGVNPRAADDGGAAQG